MEDTSLKKIRFQGQEFYLIGETDGAIATKEQYENGLCSYAHLMPDGRIFRFLQQIGTRENIEFLGDAQLKPTFEAFVNAIDGLFNPQKWSRSEIEKG